MIYPIRSCRPGYRRGLTIQGTIAVILPSEAFNGKDGYVAETPCKNLAMPHGNPMDGLIYEYAYARDEAAFVAPIFCLVDN